jgi:hypothetical protein
LFLLVPVGAALTFGLERVVPALRACRDWLLARGDLLVALVSLGLAGYLGWQGVAGLGLS